MKSEKYLIIVYAKSNMKAKEIGGRFTNIEDYDKKCCFNVLKDYSRVLCKE